MTIPLRAYLIGGAVLALFLGYAGWAAHERSLGALRLRLAVADSAHHADSVAAIQRAWERDSLNAVAYTLRAAATVEVQKDRATKARADSAIRVTASERARAEALLSDSLASFEQTRAELQRMVDRSRADSAATVNAAEQSARTIASLRAALLADSTAIGKGVDAYNALLKRAVDAERQRDIYKSAQPSGFGNVVRGVAWAAAGAGLYAVVKR